VNEVDEDCFQRVTGRRDRKKRQKVIIGCRPRTDSISFHGVKKKAVVCVSRLDKTASVEAVTELLRSSDITVHSCFSVGHSAKTTVNKTDSEASDSANNFESSATQDGHTRDKHRYFNSMRICVYRNDLDKVIMYVPSCGQMASVFGHGCLNLSTVNMVSSDVFLIRTLRHLSYFYNGAHTLSIS